VSWWTLPENWDTAHLGDLVRIKSGFACAKKNLVPAGEGVAHLRPFNVGTNGEMDLSEVYYIPPDYKNNIENYALEPGHVLFNNTNSVELVGKTALVTQPMQCAFSNHIYRLTVKDKAKRRLEPAWLTLVLRRLWAMGYFAEYCNRWIGQAGFNSKMLKDVEIPIPPLDEQRRIVARVEELFAHIEEAQRLRADQDAERLMESIREQVFRELEQTVSARPQLKDIADSRLGKMLSKEAKKGVRPKPYLRNANVQWDHIDLSELYEMDFDKSEEDKYRLQPGDLLVCEGGEIGRAAVWEGELEECYFQKALHRVRLRNPNASPRYLMHFIAWASTSGAIAELRTGSAIPHLTGVRLKTLEVVWPSTSEQYRIVKYLDGVQAQVTELKRLQTESAAELKRLSGAVLARAFRGEL
jgi:type I restriction enzyme S subunit